MFYRARVGTLCNLAVIALFLSSSATLHAAARLGAKMPEFELQALDGKFYGTKDVQGKITILSFLGHNCEPCVSAGPFIEENIWQKVRTKPNVQMIGLDVWNGNTAELTLFKTVTGTTYPLLRQAAIEGADYAGAVLEDLVVVDQDGIVRMNIDGAALTEHPRVVELVESLLANTPIVSIVTRNLYFGFKMNVGETKTLTVEIENTGPAALDITGINTSIPNITMDPPAFSVPAFEKKTITITFTPTETGTFGGDIIFEHNNNAVETLKIPMLDVPVEGSLLPSIALAQESLNFGELEIGQKSTQTLTISNTGQGSLTISSIQTALAGISFSETEFSIPANDAKDITVTFEPQNEGTLSGTINVLSNDPSNGTLSLSIAASAIAILADPRTDFDGSGLVDFGDFLAFVRAFGTADATFDLNGSGLVDFGDFLVFVNNFGRSVS